MLLVAGCLVLGTGVAMLLTADLGSDGFSTLVNGTAISTGLPFFVANLFISLAFLLVAAARRLLPGIGTVVQIVLVGLVVDRLLPVLDTPDTVLGQALLLTAAFPVLAVGSPPISARTSAPARSRLRVSPGTRRCRSSGATAWRRAAARSSAGCWARRSDRGPSR